MTAYAGSEMSDLGRVETMNLAICDFSGEGYAKYLDWYMMRNPDGELQFVVEFSLNCALAAGWTLED